MNLPTLVPDERSRRQLKGFLSNILREVAPDEVSRFDPVEEVFTASLDGQLSASGGTRGIAGGIEVGVVCLHLVTGTLALIERYRHRRERLEQQELEQNIEDAWQQALVKTGMSPELARLIPVKFSPDMIRFLMMLLSDKTDKR